MKTSNCCHLLFKNKDYAQGLQEKRMLSGTLRFKDLLSSPCVQVHTLEVFQKELNESEHLVFQALHGLQRALQGDYRDVVNMKESSRQRLEALREAAIKVSSGHQCFMDTMTECRREEILSTAFDK